MKIFLSRITLMEATIALALWLILSAGILQIWHHAATSSTRIIETHAAFENTRATLDALITNIEKAHTITRLTTRAGGLLDRLSVIQSVLQPDGSRQETEYNFFFRNDGLQIGLPGGQNAFSNYIEEIRIIRVGRRLDITVKSNCDEAIILRGSVCIRHKRLNI